MADGTDPPFKVGDVCQIDDVPGIDDPEDIKPRPMLVLLVRQIQVYGVIVSGSVSQDKIDDLIAIPVPNDSTHPNSQHGLWKPSWAVCDWLVCAPACRVSKRGMRPISTSLVSRIRDRVQELRPKMMGIACDDQRNLGCSHCRR